MRVSVVVRSRNEAFRLRLMLASLMRQIAPVEVVVVNDGSVDHTLDVLDEAANDLDLVVVSNAAAMGRSEASNIGALRATGDVLIFMDGDTLACPALVARHRDVHRDGNTMGRGETYHIRKTRFFSDPENATPLPIYADRVARMGPDELARARLTMREVVEDFAAVERAGEPGIYPGLGPRRLYEVEMDALHNHPDCPVLWAAAAGSNLSIRRDAFLALGGFDAAIDINEHRELALRFCAAGGRVVPVPGARSYHLTHRIGWRDPLADTGWEERFYERHPLAAVKLLNVFWASVSGGAAVSPGARIMSLPALAEKSALGLTSDQICARDDIRAQALLHADRP